MCLCDIHSDVKLPYNNKISGCIVKEDCLKVLWCESEGFDILMFFFLSINIFIFRWIFLLIDMV